MKRGFECFAPLFAGSLPERVPIVCNLYDQGAKIMGMDLEEYYSQAEHVFEGQTRLLEHFKLDTLSGALYAAIDAEVLGARHTIFAVDGPPNVGHMVIHNPVDMKDFKLPTNIKNHPALQKELELVKALNHWSAGRYPVISVVTASFSLPILLMGVDKWLSSLLHGDEDSRRDFLRTCSEYVVTKANLLAEAGADFIAYANPLATATFINREQFDRWAREWIEWDFRQVPHQKMIYFCGGGRLEPLLEPIVESCAAPAYYLHPLDHVGRARQIIGPNGLIIGSINDIKMLSWTKQELQDEVKSIMERGKKAGGFVFGTLMMPYHISDTMIMTMMKAGKKYGSYA